MAWKFEHDVPVSIQITRRLRLEILNGKYSPGEQFPPVRQLAYEASVNPNTMQKALSSLESEKLLVSRGTVGRFVTDDVSVLTAARKKEQEEYMRLALGGAADLGITKEDFINYIKESEEVL